MKYELTQNTIEVDGITLYQIRAIKSFCYVIKGELGGYIQSTNNLSQEGNCWVSGNACVYGNALVYGSAQVSGNAQVSGEVFLSGNAHISDNYKIKRNSDYLVLGPFGDNNIHITYFHSDKRFRVCSNIYDIDSFEKAVFEKYGIGSSYDTAIKMLKSL